MAPPRSIALRKKPDTRTSSINALTAASAAGRSFGTTIFCGTLNRSSANSLVPGVAVESVVRRSRFAPSASIVRTVSALLNSAGLFSNSTIVACLRMRFMHSVIESLTVPAILDVGDRLDRRAVEHEKALPHQHVGLGEFHRSEPRRLIGDKADVGLSVLDRLDDGR